MASMPVCVGSMSALRKSASTGTGTSCWDWLSMTVEEEERCLVFVSTHDHGRTCVDLIVSIVSVIDRSMDPPTSSMPTHA